MVWQWPTMVAMGDGELGFDSDLEWEPEKWLPHLQGRQQVCKLPNPDLEVATAGLC